jgi:hypothetical protein
MRVRSTKARMTKSAPEPVTKGTAKRPIRKGKPSAIPVFAALAALTVGTFAYLTAELASGKDPALGPDAITAVTPKRPTIIRKVIRRKVVTTVVPAPTASPSYTAGSSSYGGYSSGGTSYSAPSTSYSAPAPAPAPVVTASS